MKIGSVVCRTGRVFGLKQCKGLVTTYPLSRRAEIWGQEPQLACRFLLAESRMRSSKQA